MAGPFLTLDLPDEAATAALAEDVAAVIGKGDIIALSGDLGAGKTCFARALIRAVAGDPSLEVPSPTFTLVQTYTLPQLTIAHIDLYRVREASEIDETGLIDATAEGAALIEWPERAGGLLSGGRLEVALEIAGNGRRATLSGDAAWHRRIARSREIRAFVEGNGFPLAHRTPADGFNAPAEASERVSLPGRRALLIDDREGSLDGKNRTAAGSAAASRALRDLGLSAPETFASDPRMGLSLVDDLGGESFLDDAGQPAAERYLVAIEALAEIHFRPRSGTLGHGPGAFHIPDLAGDVLEQRAALFADHYFTETVGAPLAKAHRETFGRLWWSRFERLVEAEQTWLFDPASLTLAWLADRDGLRRIAFTDLGQIRLGAAAHDIVALCNDGGVTLSAEIEGSLHQHYVGLRQAAQAHFDAARFAEEYAIAAALRASAGMGAAAIALKAGADGAAEDLARHREYLRRALAHPVLSDLAVWYEEHLPQH